MVRRVLSIVTGAEPPRPAQHVALELNAYAVAEDLELAVVLVGDAVELAAAAPVAVDVSTAVTPALPALVASGVRVVVSEEDVALRGLDRSSLLAGVEPASVDVIADLIATHDVTLRWARP